MKCSGKRSGGSRTISRGVYPCPHMTQQPLLPPPTWRTLPLTAYYPSMLANSSAVDCPHTVWISWSRLWTCAFGMYSSCRSAILTSGANIIWSIETVFRASTSPIVLVFCNTLIALSGPVLGAAVCLLLNRQVVCGRDSHWWAGDVNILSCC